MPRWKKNPIIVVVQDGRYETYGLPTFKNRWKAKFLEAMGGVNESVEDGEYIFDVKWRGLFLTVSLLPYPPK